MTPSTPLCGVRFYLFSTRSVLKIFGKFGVPRALTIAIQPRIPEKSRGLRGGFVGDRLAGEEIVGKALGIRVEKSLNALG